MVLFEALGGQTNATLGRDGADLRAEPVAAGSATPTVLRTPA